ncbi:MAG: hypothetical protein HZB35_02150 [Nitrospirae bacterium]|nr:hypothetical protein [Nitrospirota bacterium]
MISKISLAEFSEKYKLVHDAIFSGRSVFQMPFEHLEWDYVILPGRIHIADDILQALASAAIHCGDICFIATSCEADMAMPHEDSIVGSWEADRFGEIDDVAPVLSSTDNHVFGKSGRWGMIRYYDDFSCVGGDKGFMEIFLGSLGGRDTLKERFRRFDSEGWYIDKDYKSKILRSVGWD